MSTTFVDEFKLRELYGIELKYLELVRLRDEAQKLTEEEIKEFEKLIRD